MIDMTSSSLNPPTFDEIARVWLGGAASVKLMKRQAPGELPTSAEGLTCFLSEVRKKVGLLYGEENPRVAVVIPCFNEEREILSTLLSYLVGPAPRYPTELLCVDNNSTDRTPSIAEACGVRVIQCQEQGLPYARRAGVLNASPGVEYVVLTDADSRTESPETLDRWMSTPSACPESRLFFDIAIDYMERFPGTVGVSTGIRIERRPRIVAGIRALLRPFVSIRETSFWTGPNQVWLRSALKSSGAMEVEFPNREDHRRMHMVNKWASATGKRLVSGADEAAVLHPVYASGRRFNSTVSYLGNLVRHKIRSLKWRLNPHGKYTPVDAPSGYKGQSSKPLK